MKCDSCGKSLTKRSSWKCTKCWKELAREVELPDLSALRSMSWNERALALLYFAGRDITEYFDNRSSQVRPEDAIDLTALDTWNRPPIAYPIAKSWHGHL